MTKKEKVSARAGAETRVGREGNASSNRSQYRAKVRLRKQENYLIEGDFHVDVPPSVRRERARMWRSRLATVAVELRAAAGENHPSRRWWLEELHLMGVSSEKEMRSILRRPLSLSDGERGR